MFVYNMNTDVRTVPVISASDSLADGLIASSGLSSTTGDFIQDIDGGTIANSDYDIFKTQKDLDDVLSDINNGRVSDINVMKPTVLDNQLPENVIINSDNAENSVKGIIEQTALSNYFFSQDNINIIQDTIRYRVYSNTQQTISRQSENELFIIMRSILLQFGNFRSGANTLADELRKLNKIVVDFCVEEVSSNVLQYVQYIKDLGQLPTPIDFPVASREFNYTYDISNLM